MSSRSLFLVVSPLVASLFAVGCSGSSDPASPGPLGTSTGGGDAGDAAPAAPAKDDAGSFEPSVFVSNTPGVHVVDKGSPATPDLVLLSSNLLQEPSGTQVYQQWLGEIQNNGATPACSVQIDASFKSSAGAEVSAFESFADGEPYSDGGTVTMGCIPPGKIGSFYANGFIAASVPLASIATLEVKMVPFTFEGTGAEPNIDAPTLSTRVAPVFSTDYGIRGSIVGGARVISNIRADFFPRDSKGLVLAQLTSVDLDSLEPGASFDVSTSGIETGFTQYRSFVSFIDQAADARRILGSGAPSPIEKAAAAVQTHREETAARAARFRSSAR